MSTYIAEAVGTLILILLGNGTVANVLLGKTKGHNSGWIVITTGWGLAVTIAVYSVGRISGAHINPAVTIGLASIGAFSWQEVPGYVLAQMIGGFIGAILVWLAYLPHWSETSDPQLKLGVFCNAPAIRQPFRNFITEVIATALLIFGVLAIAANAQELTTPGDIDLSRVFSLSLQPLLVGFLVWSIGISLGGPTGYAINPARDLAPRIAHALLPIPGKGSSDWNYSWIPVMAPICGGIMGAMAYELVGF